MSFIILLLEWYQVHKRPLPWRNTKNPFHVWLSEIILQQTRIQQGLNYYLKFVGEFSNVHELAKVDEQTVLKLWQGLGYYTRARNLHKTAKIISHNHQGEFPNTFKVLKKLPGIGNYTAAAIASICFNEKVPAIDGNAYRVYSRLFGLNKDIGQSNAHKFFFEFAKEIMPEQQTGDFNQAIMELGATICLPQNPICTSCPVARHCVAFQTGKTENYPINSKKIKIKKRYFHYFFMFQPESESFLIRKRDFQDVWQNLYDLPFIETTSKNLNNSDFEQYQFKKTHQTKHILTHQHLNIQFYELLCTKDELEKFNIQGDYIKVKINEVSQYPFPKPIADFLENRFGL